MQYVETLLPCGCTLVAEVTDTEEDRARAESLGYPEPMYMHVEHDPIHLLLSLALGLKTSPALHYAQHGGVPGAETPQSELRQVEEEMVLAAQRFLNLARKQGLVHGWPDPQHEEPET